MISMKTTDYIVKATLEKQKYLLSIQISKEFQKTVWHGRICKPLKYSKPAMKKDMSLCPDDLLFIIEDVKEADIKKYAKVFTKGEYCRIDELKLVSRDNSLFLDGIELIPVDQFLRQLIRTAGIMIEDPPPNNQLERAQ